MPEPRGGRPRLLDLFCKAGGAGMGYHLAGFEVVGVDIEPQPNYPFEFHQADALAMRRDRLNGCWHEGVTTTLPGRLAACLGHFDAVHASPPCHDHSALSGLVGQDGTGWMLHATIDLLRRLGVPWVVENVGMAKMPEDVNVVQLCGQQFGLGVRRHRKFASDLLLLAPPPCRHRRTDPPPIGVYGGGPSKAMRRRGRSFGVKASAADSRIAMGIDWMTRAELAQAIPPAYTAHIGAQLLAHVTTEEVA